MPDPVASLFLGAVALVAVGVLFVWLLLRALKLAPRLPALDDPRREARFAVLVAVAVYPAVIFPLLVPFSGTSSLTDPGMVVQVALTHALLLAPVAVAGAAKRQSWASFGLSRSSLPRLVVLGLVPSVPYLPSVGLTYPVASFPGAVPLAIGLVWSAMAGFSEEITFRGHVQTRFEAAWGTGVGYALTVVVFASAHFPGSYLSVLRGRAQCPAELPRPRRARAPPRLLLTWKDAGEPHSVWLRFLDGIRSPSRRA